MPRPSSLLCLAGAGLSPCFTKQVANTLYMQVRHRNKWVNRWMIRDVKRRQMVKEYGPVKLRLVALLRDRTLPKEFQELAGKELSALPRDAHVLRTTNRCVITSKPRGVVPGWRLSRIVWRAQADYNKLSGVTRAWW